MLLHDRFISVLDVTDAESFLVSVVTFAKWLEFDTVTAFAAQDHAFAETAFFVVDNEPVGFSAITDRESHGKLDPVMQHCKTSCLPIAWSRATYLAAGKADMWEAQAEFGYVNGICLAAHLPAGQHFCIGVDRDGPLPSCPLALARAVADLQLFAAYAQEVALRVLLPNSSPSILPALTHREVQCLQWTMEGKTAWEVGRILSISEQTAVRHLNNATHKLGCVNKHQAVVKALRLRLVQ
jgi:DNA-binding CsgD family transcriptional regulator